MNAVQTTLVGAVVPGQVPEAVGGGKGRGVTTLADGVLRGDIRAAARLLRDIEDESPDAVAELKALYPRTGQSYVIGITGAPGAGKSTLLDALIDCFRQQGKTVGVLAVDPSSPFSGGAILGDRIRMQRHSTDNGVFIRSLATRGWHGGLSKATANVIHVMDAMGRDIILVETVGVGQAEVDVMHFVQTALVVLVPGTGDWVQTLKAGILEIGNVFVINKADKPGVREVQMELEAMLEMDSYAEGSWKPRVFLTEAVNRKGVTELIEGIEAHRKFLVSSGRHEKQMRERSRRELLEGLKAALVERVMAGGGQPDYLEYLVGEVAERRTDPYTAANELMEKVIGRGGAAC